MIGGHAFARAAAMFALVQAAMRFPMGERQAKLDAIGPYVSRGKGEGRSNRTAPAAGMASVRKARKARNVARNRRAHRG